MNSRVAYSAGVARDLIRRWLEIFGAYIARDRVVDSRVAMDARGYNTFEEPPAYSDTDKTRADQYHPLPNGKSLYRTIALAIVLYRTYITHRSLKHRIIM